MTRNAPRCTECGWASYTVRYYRDTLVCDRCRRALRSQPDPEPIEGQLHLGEKPAAGSSQNDPDDPFGF